MTPKPIVALHYAIGLKRIKDAAQRAYVSYYYPFRIEYDLKRRQLI